MKKILLPLVLLLSVLSVSGQYTHIQEDFNSAALPNGWSTTAVTGSATWSFGIDGSVLHAGNNNLDGTSMAFFDDDALGAGQINNTAVLLTPTFDNSNFARSTVEFDFNYKDFLGPVDSFYVEVFDGVNWVMVFSVDTNNCGDWLACAGNFPSASIDISNYSNANCQVRFTFFDGNDWVWYVGIDNVKISFTIPKDMGAINLVEPTSKCRLTANEQLTVQLTNYGSDTIRNFSVFADGNNGAILLHDTVNSIIAPFDTINYTFNSSIDLSMVGRYNFKIYTQLNLDSAYSNDTLNTIIENEPVFMPSYLDDFENSNDWSTGGANSTWELGIPNGVVINSATSGTDAFCTNLNGNYNDNELSYLYSPCFDFSQNSGAPTIQFYINYFTEPNFDSLKFEYTIDNGITWNKVEEELNVNNWYSKGNNWEGNSNGWQKVTNTLISLTGEPSVKFRFVFESDISFTREGIAIDDFEILATDSIDLSVDFIGPDSTSFFNCSFGNQNIEVILANKGFTTVDSINLFYQVNGGAIVNELFTDSVSKYGTKLFRFNNSYDFSSAGTYNIKAWLQLSGDTLNKNDTVSYQLIQRSAINNNFLKGYYKENFDSFGDSSCLNSALVYTGDTLKNGWKQISTGQFGWHVQNGLSCGGTPSLATGPSLDHTTGTGNFLFTEASLVPVPITDTARIESPCVDFSNETTAGMRFWYHRYGGDIGNLYIDVFANGIWNLAVDSLVGQSQTSSNDAWKMKKIVFNQFANQVINVRFTAIYGGGFNGDMAIDDVEFYTPITQDAKLEKVELLNPSCEFDSAILRLEVNNFGTDTIAANQLKIKYQLNSGSTFTDSNLTTIAADSSQVLTFNLSGLYTNGSDKITAWVELPNDSNQFNDTLNINYEQLTKAPEYLEGFENIVPSNGFCGNYNTPLNLAWQVDANSQWVAGHDTICSYGASGATPTSSTGPDSAYAGHGFMYFEPGYNSVLDTAVLTSTCIDLRNDSISYLDFYYHMYGAGTGKLYIDAIVNGVATRLDSIVGQQHFSATDPWSLKTINLNQFAGDIVRFRFTAIESTNTSISDQGAISIDNVRISNSFPVSIQETTTSNSFQLFPNPTNGEFILRGNGFSTSELVISLLDLNGRVIESRIVNPTSNTINERFDLSNQANGVYFISIQSEGKVEVKKVVLTGR